MALVQSVSVPLGSRIPSFSLPDPHGTIFSNSDLFGSQGLLLVVTCNHCPYAVAVWPRLIRLAGDIRQQGIATVAINPNIHPGYPDDAPAKMADKIKEWNIPFPYLVDESQDVARLLDAQCTPDIYLYDRDHKLVYHGRIDDNWKDESRVQKHELRDAVNNLIAGRALSPDQHPSMGCSIKWKN
jgi:peroxiredoxin